MAHRTLRTSMEAYTGIETGLTASASVVLMSSTLVDRRFDNFSHHPALAENLRLDPDLKNHYPAATMADNPGEGKFSPTTADPKLTGAQMIER